MVFDALRVPRESMNATEADTATAAITNAFERSEIATSSVGFVGRARSNVPSGIATAKMAMAPRILAGRVMAPNYQVQRPGAALQHAGAPALVCALRSAARGRALYGRPARCNA
jgi:hypothetical protein